MLGGIAVTLSLSPFLLGHVIPDKVVYRGIQVVIKPDGIEVRYQLGLNENTVRRELAGRLGPKAAFPADDKGVFATYRDVMLPLLPQKLNLEIDGQALSLPAVRADLLFQHHAQIECVYWGAFPARTTPSRLTLLDENFAETPGIQTIAVKGRGDIDLLQSAAPALLVRAPVDRSEATETAIPPAASRRLEAYFCLSAPLSAVVPNGPESAGGSSTPVPGPTPGDMMGSTTHDLVNGNRRGRLQDGVAAVPSSRPKDAHAGSNGACDEHSTPSMRWPTALALLTLLGILLCVWRSRRGAASPG